MIYCCHVKIDIHKTISLALFVFVIILILFPIDVVLFLGMSLETDSVLLVHILIVLV